MGVEMVRDSMIKLCQLTKGTRALHMSFVASIVRYTVKMWIDRSSRLGSCKDEGRHSLHASRGILSDNVHKTDPYPNHPCVMNGMASLKSL